MSPIVCSHLRELLNALLANGAGIEHVETGWTDANLVVTLKMGLNPKIAKVEAEARGLKFWKNNDSHYSIEYGCFCEEHKQGISWPQNKATINAL